MLIQKILLSTACVTQACFIGGTWWVGGLSFQWSKKSRFVQLNQSLGGKDPACLWKHTWLFLFNLDMHSVLGYHLLSSIGHVFLNKVFYSVIGWACNPTNITWLVTHAPCRSEWRTLVIPWSAHPPLSPTLSVAEKKPLQAGILMGLVRTQRFAVVSAFSALSLSFKQLTAYMT